MIDVIRKIFLRKSKKSNCRRSGDILEVSNLFKYYVFKFKRLFDKKLKLLTKCLFLSKRVIAPKIYIIKYIL